MVRPGMTNVIKLALSWCFKKRYLLPLLLRVWQRAFQVSWQFKSLSRYVSSCPSSLSYLKGVIYNYYRKFFSFKYKMYKPNNESQFGIACFSILRRVAKPLKEDLLLPFERHIYILYIVQTFYFPILHGIEWIILVGRFSSFLIPYKHVNACFQFIHRVHGKMLKQKIFKKIAWI